MNTTSLAGRDGLKKVCLISIICFQGESSLHFDEIWNNVHQFI